MKEKDKRLKMMTEILQGIKVWNQKIVALLPQIFYKHSVTSFMGNILLRHFCQLYLDLEI